MFMKLKSVEIRCGFVVRCYQYGFGVSLFRVMQDYGGAHPLVMDALAEMSEAQIHRAYPSVCEYAHALPTRARTRETPFSKLQRFNTKIIKFFPQTI